ncbi:acylneuraminate cytidylyltransferase family protein [Marinoscillum furvescens]|uniref:N-acylneuraminate cytidylyltransferase n=1 Tax=Marinoscillum furvescens DSM 4134 TaxID=1122208 RepID=A0A3D9L639_MARFU|nr:acylneuraminate cytidylyltransferase family protein [Marinoscillum furvescens]REE01637.1 N-acylneuraminate cytidylyltransferase [Marinoscillum furvescens DSM 4134]
MFALIPARGGSKGIPRKNIRKLAGKPLIHYAIESARKVFPDEKIIVSTDDEEIKSVVEETGLKVFFIRPSILATDNSSTRDVILHAVNFLESMEKSSDPIVLLQPTSPFRNDKHIQEALDIYSDDLDMVVGVTETKSNPYYVLYEEDDDQFLQKSKIGRFTRRQDCPKVWEFNGAIYILNKESIVNCPMTDFKKIRKYVMDEISSIDIDTEHDWLLAETIINRS